MTDPHPPTIRPRAGCRWTATADAPIAFPTFAGIVLLRPHVVLHRVTRVIEVLSPSTARYDRGLKRDRYQRAGVPEYWVVDLEARLIERWRPSDDRPEVARTALVSHPDGAATSLAVELDRLFAEAR